MATYEIKYKSDIANTCTSTRHVLSKDKKKTFIIIKNIILLN